ncbi:MAG: GNAT family N-acetyltransferase [Candidatus Marinimicrobia bacterium]|nr:GNAT family N-acetyltransferase [Candidatus Neomarinimicrobiota bacterium]
MDYKLKNGTQITVRLLRPDDKEELRRSFEELSVDSRRHRFLSLQGRLTNRQLEYFTEIDYQNHFALCAFDMSNGSSRGVGVARYIRIVDEPEVAEFAVTVLDAYQGHGLGRILCELLIKAARENGISMFRGYISEENSSLVSMLKQYGAHSQMEEGRLMRVDLALPSAILKGDGS